MNRKEIDFKKSTISINKTAQYIPVMGTFDKAPKTFKSNREIVLPYAVFEKLELHKKEQLQERFKLGSYWEDNDKIFAQDNGTFLIK